MVGVYLNGDKGNVVLASGMPQYLDKYHPFVEQMKRLGYNLFIPKYMGTYESLGKFNTQNSIESVESVIELAKSGEGVELFANSKLKWKNDKTYLIGFSYGAFPSLLQKVDVDKTLLVCPFVSIDYHTQNSTGEDIRKTFEFLQRAYPNVYRFKTDEVVDDIAKYRGPDKKEKLFVVVGKNDSSIPKDEIEYLKTKYNPIIVEKEGGHSIKIEDEMLENLLRGNFKLLYQSVDFIKYMHELAKHNLDKLNCGNISLRLSNGLIAIKPTGMSYDQVNITNVSIVDMKGNLLSGEKPSSDVEFHLHIYKHKPEINCIIHTHSHYATVMSCLNKPLKVLTTLQADYFGKDVWCMPYTNHRTKSIGERAVKSGEKVMLLERHSSLIFDEKPIKAIKNAVILEEIAKINYHIEMINPNIKKIKDKDIDSLNNYYQNEYEIKVD